MTDHVRRLLGGYATGTLTEGERQELYAASLEDQQLFEALADEDVLKELLEDSAARATLLQATEHVKFSLTGALREWLERPKAKVLVATGCVLLAAIGYRAITELPQAERHSVQVAEVHPPSPRAPQLQSPRSRRNRREFQCSRHPGGYLHPRVRRRHRLPLSRPRARTVQTAASAATVRYTLLPPHGARRIRIRPRRLPVRARRSGACPG